MDSLIDEYFRKLNSKSSITDSLPNQEVKEVIRNGHAIRLARGGILLAIDDLNRSFLENQSVNKLLKLKGVSAIKVRDAINKKQKEKEVLKSSYDDMTFKTLKFIVRTLSKKPVSAIP